MSLGGMRIPRAASASLAQADLDARLSEMFHRRFPQFSQLFDAAVMAEQLALALRIQPSWSLRGLVPGKVFIGRTGGRLRYVVRLRERGTGILTEHPVTAFVFDSGGEAEDHARRVLAPLSEGVRGHPATVAFGATSAVLPTMRTTLHVFPIDPDLPGLAEASDPRRMRDALQAQPRLAGSGDVRIEECHISVAHYPRTSRCVLRYSLRGTASSNGDDWSAVVYGKTYSHVGAEQSLRVLERLHALAGGERSPILPTALGHVADLRLNLLGEVAGTPRIPALVKAGLAADPQAAPEIGEAVARAGVLLAELHRSPIEVSPHPSLGEEARTLRSGLEDMRGVSPGLTEVLEAEIERLSNAASEGQGGGGVFSHGDFTPSQILFNGRDVGMIDFDNTCSADPALDLGHFVAYLRVAIHKAALAGGVSREAMEASLTSSFFDGYVDAASPAQPDRIRDRMSLYQKASLIRMAIHSWQQLKPTRVALALAALDEAP
jgi:hypothetical protein